MTLPIDAWASQVNCVWCGKGVSKHPEVDYPPDPITGPEFYEIPCPHCQKPLTVYSHAIVRVTVLAGKKPQKTGNTAGI